MEERVNAYIQEVKAPRAVYEKIAVYLSNACIADNAEYALMKLFERNNRTAWNNIGKEFENDPVTGLQLAVAWLIEKSMRTNTGVIKISLENIVLLNQNSYTVTFSINDTSVSSTWILEYGIWRISTFGTDVVGDKSIVERTQQERNTRNNLVGDFDVMLQAGLAIMPDMRKQNLGLNVSAKFFLNNYITIGGDVTTNFDYTQIHMTAGLAFPIRLGPVALIPFADAGVGIILVKPIPYPSESVLPDPPSWVSDGGLGWGVKVGLVFTTQWVKGLYLYANYQYSDGSTIFIMGDNMKRNFNNNIITVGLGYGF